MRQRVDFKIVTLVHRSLSGHIPSYLADDCRLVTYADTRTLAVGRTQSTFGDRTFAAAALRLWNSLPPDLRQPELSYGQFRRSLKTFLFGQQGHRRSATTVNCALEEHLLTYLLTQCYLSPNTSEHTPLYPNQRPLLDLPIRRDGRLSLPR